MRVDAPVVARATIHGAALAEDVAIADLEPGRLAGVLLVLGRIPERGELIDVIVGADRRQSGDDGVGTHDRARTDADTGADHAERTHVDVRRQLRLRRDDGVRVDHFAVSGATMMSACATSWSPISAAVEKRQMPFR